jgi:hypothetical protein
MIARELALQDVRAALAASDITVSRDDEGSILAHTGRPLTPIEDLVIDAFGTTLVAQDHGARRRGGALGARPINPRRGA